MPDISKINAVAVADIEKLDSILAANIEKVNGLTFVTAPAFTAPTAAYSVRLLDSALGVPTYTGAAMRVRRETVGGTGDDDEADIAFDSGVISLDSAISNASAGVTATTLGQFLNVGTVNGTTYTNPDSLTVTASCLTDSWYDQSGNGNHAEQATHGSQPQIHDGTVNTDLILENGKPAVQFDGGQELNYQYSTSIGSGNYQEDWSWFAVAGPNTGGVPVLFMQDESAINTRVGIYHNTQDDTIFVLRVAQVATTTSSVTLTAGQKLLTLNGVFTSTSDRDFDSYLNGASVGTSNFTTSYNDNSGASVFNYLRIGAQYTQFLSGTMQEVIMYGSDVVSNQTTIEENINSEYLIYQPTDAPTSGLLADYTGAAAAYSVRQLSDKAVICMRIRRDMGAGNPGDDDEINIGFDANGDLDTQAISDFCTTGTGYVTRWWDQSTNGNHADQPVGGTGSNAQQPQIYNGTAVIEENGEPTIDFNGSNLLLSSTTATANNEITAFFVATPNAQGTAPGIDIFGQFHSGNAPYNIWALETYTTNDLSASYSNGNSWSGNNSEHTFTVDDQVLFLAVYDTSNIIHSKNGSAITGSRSGTFNTQASPYFLGSFPASVGGTNSFDGNVQEAIIWSTAQSATNRAAIETDVMTHFNIT